MNAFDMFASEAATPLTSMGWIEAPQPCNLAKIGSPFWCPDFTSTLGPTMILRFCSKTLLAALPVVFVLFSVANAFAQDLSAFGEPVSPSGPTAATSAAAEGVGKVRGRIECNTATNYCLFKGLALIGTIDDAMSKQLIGLFEEFDRRIDPKIQPQGFVQTEIRLNSVGGSVQAAMTIGRLLRKHRMIAVVRPTSICVSACVLIYAGAVMRLGHFNAGKIGIHQPYLDFPAQQKADPQTIKNIYESMLRDMRAYLHEMNVSEQLADEMLKVPPTAVRYLSHAEQDQLGLAIYDPIDNEISDVELAQDLGISRSELMRRQVLVKDVCYPRFMTSGDSSCSHVVISTGTVP